MRPWARRQGDVGEHQGGDFMTRRRKLYSYLLSTVAPAVIAAASMVTTSPALAQCQGAGTQTSQGGTPQTKCGTAIKLGSNPLRSFDISWLTRDPVLDGSCWYLLADRSHAGIALVNAHHLAFVRTYSAAAPAAPAAKFSG